MSCEIQPARHNHQLTHQPPNLARIWHFWPLLAHSVPCWWVGWWLWRAGCISQDTYLLYIIVDWLNILFKYLTSTVSWLLSTAVPSWSVTVLNKKRSFRFQQSPIRAIDLADCTNALIRMMSFYKFFIRLLAFAAETCAIKEPWNSDFVLGFDRLDILAVALSIKSLRIRRLLSNSHNSLADKRSTLITLDPARTRTLPGEWWWSRGWRHQGSLRQHRGPRNQVRRESPLPPCWWTDLKTSSKNYGQSTFSPAQVPSSPFSQPAMTLPSPSTNLTKRPCCHVLQPFGTTFCMIFSFTSFFLLVFVFVSAMPTNLMGSFPSLESKTVPPARKPLGVITSDQSCVGPKGTKSEWQWYHQWPY